MKGFYGSAIGAIQGHHGPLVFFFTNFSAVLEVLYLKPIPNIVIFGMKGFYVSASGSNTGPSWPSYFLFLPPEKKV